MIAGFRLPDAIARCIAPSAPEVLRLSAARGVIPMPPAERLVCLATLLADPSDDVRGAARTAWREFPPSFVRDALEDGRLPEGVLDFVAALNGSDPTVAAAVVRHPRVGARTLDRFADSQDEEVLDSMAQNQRAVERSPELLRRLLGNPNLHPGTKSRLASLLGEVADAGPPDAAEDREPTEEDLARVALPADIPARLLDDAADEGHEDPKNLYRLIQTLSVAEKIKLANLGSKEARRLLIRDTNRVVQRAVIRSPKVREDEVLPIAQDRTVSDEILRIVMERKDWLKAYPIRLALTQNPKTPVPKALRLLETLQDRDVRQIAKSRNVASPVSAAAVRLLARRGKS